MNRTLSEMLLRLCSSVNLRTFFINAGPDLEPAGIQNIVFLYLVVIEFQWRIC